MTIRAERSARWLDVVVHDNGRGLPEGFSIDKSDRLGLQIVRTLVSAELDGIAGHARCPRRRNRCGVARSDRPPSPVLCTSAAHNSAAPTWSGPHR